MEVASSNPVSLTSLLFGRLFFWKDVRMPRTAFCKEIYFTSSLSRCANPSGLRYAWTHSGRLDVKFLERCPSGLRYTLGRGAWQKCHLGFESPSFRNKKKSQRDFFYFGSARKFISRCAPRTGESVSLHDRNKNFRFRWDSI